MTKIQANSMLQLICTSRAQFESDLEVLNYLFFTIGNGYAWENGRLVNLFEDEKSKAIMAAVVGKNYQLVIDYPSYALYNRQEDKRVFYPICEFSRIMTMPEDVQQDFIDIGEMLVDTLMANRNSSEQIKWGKKAKKHIQKLRDKRERK